MINIIKKNVFILVLFSIITSGISALINELTCSIIQKTYFIEKKKLLIH